MQSVNFTNSYFKSKFGYPLPPKILDVKSIEDVTKNIKDCYSKFTKSPTRDKDNISWFKLYNSHALAKRWLNLFHQITENKS